MQGAAALSGRSLLPPFAGPDGGFGERLSAN
jgi:hypothetical protein